MEETTGPDFQHKSNGGLRNPQKSMNTTMHGPSHHHTANYSYYRPPTFLPHRRFHDQPIPGFENNFPSNHFPRPSSPTMRSGGYQAQAFASPDSPFTGLIPHDIGGNSNSTMVQGGHANNNVRGPALSDHITRYFTPSGSGYGPPIPGTPGAVDTFPQRGFYRGPYPHYSFPETNPLPIPILRANIVNQIEYYFSDKNLQSDYFLISLMDDQGWVPISNIAEFRRVKTMNVEIPFILDALQTSTTVEVQGEKIRRRDVWSQWIPASVNSNTSSPVSNADTNDC